MSRAVQVVYDVFGLRVASEIAMPELLAASDSEGQPDVTIVRGDLEPRWSQCAESNQYYVFAEGEMLLRIPGTALFSIRGGTHITVSPFVEADDQMVKLYLLGTCLGVILLQRGTLPLHGSAVVIDGMAYAFVGESGAGKSTLSAAFRERGYPLVSDDVLAVKTDTGSNPPTLFPAYPQQKLWQTSLDQLGLDSAHYRTLYSNKFAVPAVESFHAKSVPLGGVFELVKADDQEKVELVPVSSITKLMTLHAHTFRHYLVAPLGVREWHFQAISSVAGRLPIFQLRRPTQGYTAPQLVDLIIQTVRVSPAVGC